MLMNELAYRSTEIIAQKTSSSLMRMSACTSSYSSYPSSTDMLRPTSTYYIYTAHTHTSMCTLHTSQHQPWLTKSLHKTSFINSTIIAQILHTPSQNIIVYHTKATFFYRSDTKNCKESRRNIICKPARNHSGRIAKQSYHTTQ
jgi:hypothetical protein